MLAAGSIATSVLCFEDYSLNKARECIDPIPYYQKMAAENLSTALNLEKDAVSYGNDAVSYMLSGDYAKAKRDAKIADNYSKAAGLFEKNGKDYTAISSGYIKSYDAWMRCAPVCRFLISLKK